MSLKPSRSGNLVWLDTETSTLEPTHGRLLEVGMIVTSPDLEELDRMDVSISFPEGDLENWSEFSLNTHSENGLIDHCREHGLELREAEDLCVDFIKHWSMQHLSTHEDDPGRIYRPPMCGNSIHFDRKWLSVFMPTLLKQFSHRQVDVSSFYELFCRWDHKWAAMEPGKEEKETPHRVLGDLENSIGMLREYRRRINF